MSRIQNFNELTFPDYTNQVLAERARSALSDFHRQPMSLLPNRNPEIFFPQVLKLLVAFLARDAEANGSECKTFDVDSRQVRYFDSRGIERLSTVNRLNKFEVASALSLFCEREEEIQRVKFEEMLERKRQKGLAKPKK